MEWLRKRIFITLSLCMSNNDVFFVCVCRWRARMGCCGDAGGPVREEERKLTDVVWLMAFFLFLVLMASIFPFISLVCGQDWMMVI